MKPRADKGRAQIRPSEGKERQARYGPGDFRSDADLTKDVWGVIRGFHGWPFTVTDVLTRLGPDEDRSSSVSALLVQFSNRKWTNVVGHDRGRNVYQVHGDEGAGGDRLPEAPAYSKDLELAFSSELAGGDPIEVLTRLQRVIVLRSNRAKDGAKGPGGLVRSSTWDDAADLLQEAKRRLGELGERRRTP